MVPRQLLVAEQVAEHCSFAECTRLPCHLCSHFVRCDSEDAKGTAALTTFFRARPDNSRRGVHIAIGTVRHAPRCNHLLYLAAPAIVMLSG